MLEKSTITNRKRKQKGPKKVNNSLEWKSIDVNQETLFAEALDGFMGLDELHDYNEDDLQEILAAPVKKKKKKLQRETKDNDTKVEEVTKVNDEPQEVKEDIASTGNEVKEDIASTGDTDKKSKKELRKEKRKLRHKLVLKEKRKRLKDLKKKKRGEDIVETKAKHVEVVNVKKSAPTSTYVNDMSEWNGLGVPHDILKALSEKGYIKPTTIQKESLPSATFYHQDIVGAAETGSGKTLAFVIPILTHIIGWKKNIIAKHTKQEKITTHTKENLKTDQEENNAQEVEKRETNPHVEVAEDKNQQENEDDNPDENENSDDDERNEQPLYALILTPTRELAVQIQTHITTAAKYTDIKSVAIVGGLASAKQERLLRKSPEIVVGTPGRLHKLITNGEIHLNKLSSLRCFVIDECDRMLEHGHFKELNDIVDMINLKKNVKQQNFLFSATLTLPTFHKNFKKKAKKEDQQSDMEVLINKVNLNPKAKVIDLTTKHVTAPQLTQMKVMCTNEEKEIYLVYFLMMHPGRSIVFVNSISCTRRLCSLLALLGREPLQLHAGKQQRQRLSYLEKFTASESGLLIATDVAARGLDIPQVKNVIHFQLPIDPKVYIHRSGRTARANEDGISFILVGPEDFKHYQKISKVLKLSDDIPTLSIERGFLDGIKHRVQLARDIDKEEYHQRKTNANDNWFKRNSKALDIEYDNGKDEDDNQMSKAEKFKLKMKHKELTRLLNVQLLPKGFSGSYPTRSGGLVVPGMQPLIN